jgi:hypothetical protein
MAMFFGIIGFIVIPEVRILWSSTELLNILTYPDSCSCLAFAQSKEAPLQDKELGPPCGG